MWFSVNYIAINSINILLALFMRLQQINVIKCWRKLLNYCIDFICQYNIFTVRNDYFGTRALFQNIQSNCCKEIRQKSQRN